MKSLITLFWFLILILIIASCTAITDQPHLAPKTLAPMLKSTKTTILIENTRDNSGKNITVLAAASLSEPFNELGKVFENANPGIKVIFSFAGSQQLAQQISESAPADIFASASAKYMDAIVAADKVKTENVLIFVENKLVIIYPADNPAGILSLPDLAKPGVKLDLASAEVPVGKYSLDFLDKTSKDPSFPIQFKETVLQNVVSYEDNVKTILTKVQLGEVDAGIVYSSDTSGKDITEIGKLDIPEELNVTARYPIAPLSNSENPDLAQAFIQLVMSSQGQAILANSGFVPVK